MPDVITADPGAVRDSDAHTPRACRQSAGRWFLAVAELTIASSSAFCTETATSLHLTRLFVVFATTHLFLDSASLN